MMISPKTTILFQFILFLVSYLLSWCEATNAYIYYTDAECTDSTAISGSFNLGYDDASLSGWGYTISNYVGECIYLKGGSLDLNSNSDVWESMRFGYCVTCDGVAMCSSDTTCENAVIVTASNLYT